MKTYSITNTMNENDKIMNIIEKVFKATSVDTAVTLEQVIEKGIQMGVAIDYPRGKEDGHPWYPRTSVLMGVGSVDAVMANEEVYLHRKKMRKSTGGSAFFYWVDKSRKHECVTRKQHPDGLKQTVKSEYSTFPKVPITLTLAEKIAKMNANPGMYRLIGDKLVAESWVKANPEKFQQMYGEQL